MIKKILHRLRFLLSRKNKTTFRYDGRDYRLTGYYFTYETSDKQHLHARVNKLEANTISGYGIAGCIVPINDVKWLRRISKHHGESSDTARILKDRDRYLLLRGLPKGLSSNTVDELITDRILEDMLGNDHEHESHMAKFPQVEEMHCPTCRMVTGHKLRGGGKNMLWSCIYCGHSLTN